MATPTCVQHALTNSNENFEVGNAFVIRLADPTLANNCIALALLYQYSATRTVAVTDDQGNTWPSPTRVIDDTSRGPTDSLTSAVYVLPNVAAGTRAITVTFDTALKAFAASMSEWYNVATSSPLDGNNGAVGASPAASGSITTTVNGDLIIHWGFATGWGIQLNSGFNDGCTTWTKQSGFTKLHGNREEMFFCEYAVQGTAGAINPSSSFSGGSASGEIFNSLTVALKNATAGTAPNTTKARVYGLSHGAFSNVATNGNYAAWTPFAGNLGVLITSYPSSGLPINSASGAVAGAFTLVAPGAPGGIPQAVYKTSMTSSDDEVLTLNLSTGSSGKLQFLVYDVVHAGSLDTIGTAVLGGFAAGPVDHCPDITPGITTGLTIATGEFGTGPPSSCTAPTGALFDCGFYTGYTDLSPWDSGDANGHLYFTSNALQNWTWIDTQATGNANGLALTFADGVFTTSRPIGQAVT